MGLRPEPPGGSGPGPDAADPALPGPVPGPRRSPGHQRAPASTHAGPPARRRAPRQRPRRKGLLLTVLVLSLAGVVAAAAGLVVQFMPRTFSAAQKQQITAWEMGKRWRAWSAGEIFPGTVRYQVPGLAFSGPEGLALHAQRVGIARQVTCRAATDPSVARVLARYGCLAVLRATYDDATHSLAVTVGVAVLPGPAAARASLRALPRQGGGASPGVRSLPFGRTVVARFGNRQRQLSWRQDAGPYVVFATVGYADGRRRVHEATNVYATAEMQGLQTGVGGWVAGHMGAAPPPPSCPGGPAC